MSGILGAYLEKFKEDKSRVPCPGVQVVYCPTPGGAMYVMNTSAFYIC